MNWFAILDDHVSIQQIECSWKHGQKKHGSKQDFNKVSNRFTTGRVKNQQNNLLSKTLKTLSFADLLKQKNQMK